jgi:HSP20 family molecular chaperone IbpA
MSWEIRGPWPSVEEVEWRFEELIRARWRVASVPAADVYLLGDEMWVEMDAAGVAAEDLRVRVEAETLVVEGVRRQRLPREDARPARLERPKGPFRRLFALPTRLRRPQLEVAVEAGVLRVRVHPGTEGSAP